MLISIFTKPKLENKKFKLYMTIEGTISLKEKNEKEMIVNIYNCNGRD